MAYENIIVETRGRVGLVTLNRPKALNALNAGADRGTERGARGLRGRSRASAAS